MQHIQTSFIQQGAVFTRIAVEKEFSLLIKTTQAPLS